MDILVEIHIGSDWDGGGFNCARLSLGDKAIKNILKLAKRARNGQTIQEFDYTPELGITDLDIENRHYLDIAKLSEEDPQQAVFMAPDANSSDAPRVDVVQLNVDSTSFWFEGRFKHTDLHWETRMIPLEFLPQPAKQSGKATAADLDMTAEEMNAIHEKIAKGIAHGLNAREIEATFNRHVTKAQLVRCMIELIERSH